jgi:hypothetical protein
MKLSELAEQTESTIEHGSPDLEITSTAGLESGGPGRRYIFGKPQILAADRRNARRSDIFE